MSAASLPNRSMRAVWPHLASALVVALLTGIVFLSLGELSQLLGWEAYDPLGAVATGFVVGLVSAVAGLVTDYGDRLAPVLHADAWSGAAIGSNRVLNAMSERDAC